MAKLTISMKEIFEKKIKMFVQKSGKKPIPYRELLKKCRPKGKELKDLQNAVQELKDSGKIYEKKTGFVTPSAMGAFTATVNRVNKTFGFIRKEDETEVFIPGKYLMGAMPGDKVLACLIPSRTGNPEGQVLQVIEENTAQFTGTVLSDNGRFYILPDSLTKNPLLLRKSSSGVSYAVGDKVLAVIVSRGERHSDHKAEVISCFGSAMKASSCARSVLELNGIEPEFPEDVQEAARKISAKGISEEEINSRTDLRSEAIFTIDSADTKDIDDAVSIKKFDGFYELGVHIADVSYYVKPNSPIDKDAFGRGTSIYYADRVVPMLPKELSNGICSLNPNEDRLAFSCIMIVGEDGKLQDFEFKKTVICSRVKGVYAEINQILDGTESHEIKEKYAPVRESIALMKELADVLTANKLRRGAPQIETAESKLIINEDDICVDVKERTRGASELIIEEFMLMANQAAATLGRMREIPFVYRIHENPAPEKVEQLKDMLIKLNIELPKFSSIKPSHMAKILDEERGTKMFPVVNRLVLRAMAKAKYSTEPVGHFGLVLSDYAHFTSPIRRYPDLTIHRILSDLVNGVPEAVIKKRYTAFSNESANHSTETELTAMKVERDCEDCYKAEYMSSHLGEEFTGVISSATEFGFYVELPNTVEGLVHADSLTDGIYEFDGVVSYRSLTSGKKYTVGDEVKVICAKADVSSGNIDFSLVLE